MRLISAREGGGVPHGVSSAMIGFGGLIIGNLETGEPLRADFYDASGLSAAVAAFFLSVWKSAPADRERQ